MGKQGKEQIDLSRMVFIARRGGADKNKEGDYMHACRQGMAPLIALAVR